MSDRKILIVSSFMRLFLPGLVQTQLHKQDASKESITGVTNHQLVKSWYSMKVYLPKTEKLKVF